MQYNKNILNGATQCYLTESQACKNFIACPHSPYSPDLIPHNFWLFLKDKRTMKGKCSVLVQDIQAAMTARLVTLIKQDFHNCFKKS